MIYYLNRGLILEQALVDIIHKYFHRLKLDEVYSNFHISITNEHPFAHLILHSDAVNTSDQFPSIVITTQQENKVPELSNLPPEVNAVALTSEDIEKITNIKRVRTVIDESGEEVIVKRKGEKVMETIPGYCLVTDQATIDQLKELADQEGQVYGVQFTTRRRDHVSIEIWTENNQLKNELYEQLNLFLCGSIDKVLSDGYQIFDPVIFDNSISGERSNNFNFDFDVPLYGSHFSFDVDYCVSQILIDTEIKEINKNLIWEVINHVKD